MKLDVTSEMKRPRSAKSPSAEDLAVGRNIRVRRMARGLSQSQLARRLGVTFQQVQKYEKGINRIGGGRLARIAEVLSVPVTALFEGIDEAPAAEVARSLGLMSDSRSYRLATAFAVITEPRVRLSIIELVEKVAAMPNRTEAPRRGRRRKAER